MKTTKITLISHYFGFKLNLRINAVCASILQSLEKPIDGINADLDRNYCGYNMKYISKGQAKKINTFFGEDNKDYFDEVIF